MTIEAAGRWSGPRFIISGATDIARWSSPTLPGVPSRNRLAQRQTTGNGGCFSGLALAYLGRKADAVREGLRGLELMPISRDGYFGPYVQLQLVRIYMLVGEPEKAMDQLEPLLKVPFYLSPGWLRIDPTFDPLRTNPRFIKLLEAQPG